MSKSAQKYRTSNTTSA